MTRHTLAISLLVLPSLLACPDPPAEILGAAEISTKTANGQAQPVNQGGPQGDPSAMDLSPGGTLLLDLAAAVPQHTQAQLKASTEPMVTIAGTLQGSCEGGAIRIDVIEILYGVGIQRRAHAQRRVRIQEHPGKQQRS